jgi:cell division protein FtsB
VTDQALDLRGEWEYHTDRNSRIVILSSHLRVKDHHMSVSGPSHNQFAVGIALVVAIAVVGGLVWAFGQQLALSRQMLAEELRLENAVAAKQDENDYLVAQAEYVKSDEYVEHWARKDMVMTKRDEIAVVESGDTDEEPASDAQLAPPVEPEAQPFWVELWEFVFGSPAANP